jgi:hypothetical protein
VYVVFEGPVQFGFLTHLGKTGDRDRSTITIKGKKTGLNRSRPRFFGRNRFINRLRLNRLKTGRLKKSTSLKLSNKPKIKLNGQKLTEILEFKMYIPQ